MQGTLGYYVNGKKTKNGSLTTPNYETLHQNGFSKFKNKYNFVFEASSHALHQDRIKKYPINIAAITNITHDHLDYHKSILNYKNSKFKDMLYGENVKVIRGGSFHKMKHGLMKEFIILPYRNFAPPQERFWDTGFRCAKSI